MRQNGKVKEIEELAKELRSVRGQRKVVLCHGVFDLLHIGHIRHLQQAKQLGDILVVTITPDRYVNKGPHRPAFTQDLRAEAIAALRDVDYVALNKWPMAVEVIRLLRPDIYVKGSDYQDAEKDHTGGITLEEDAIKSVDGKLVFTNDITFSASRLINRYLPSFPKETVDYLQDFSGRYGTHDIFPYFENARPLKVLVIGEAIIDEYVYCEAIGKSAKEPTLAVKHLSTEKFGGGILAVGNHVASFCDQVRLVSFLGTENSQEDFIRENLRANIEDVFLYRKGTPTVTKRRFVESYFFTKLLEVYEVNDEIWDEAYGKELCDTLSDLVPKHDVVILVDFGHGMMSRDAIDIVCDKARFLALNAQSNAGNLGYHAISKYKRADYVCFAENEIRLEARDRRGDLRPMILDLSQRLSCGKMVVTRGKRGSLAYSEREGFIEVPALAGQVIDRMGAGDAFLSVTALCVAQNAPMEIVSFVGNAVGAQAVATVGHRTSIERAPLFKQIESLLK